jgi:hypothetical protein
MQVPASGSQTLLAHSELEPQYRHVDVISSQTGAVTGQLEPVKQPTQVLLTVSQTGVAPLHSESRVHAAVTQALFVHTKPDPHDLGVVTPNGSQSPVEVQQNSGLGRVHAAMTAKQQTLKNSR